MRWLISFDRSISSESMEIFNLELSKDYGVMVGVFSRRGCHLNGNPTRERGTVGIIEAPRSRVGLPFAPILPSIR